MNIESCERKKSEFDLFREEIAKIKEKEMLKKKEWKERGEDFHKKRPYDPHFEDINSEDLTDEDRIIYEKFNNGTMTFGEFSKYKHNILTDCETRKVDEVKDSRANFYAWICNKVSSDKKWLKKFAEERK